MMMMTRMMSRWRTTTRMITTIWTRIMTRVYQLWDYIETWGFCVDIKDIKDIKGINLMMMKRWITMRWRATTTTTTWTAMMTKVSQLWD